MKKFKTLLLGLAGILFGCQQAELVDPDMVGGQPMKTVTISTEMDADMTKAALDSQTGQFSWQSGDVISVLATDGKFYDFTLTEGADSWKAEFKGSIPKSAEITTVATYPSFVANGTENTLLDGTTFKYVLPSEWTWKKEVSNVPMVSTFGEGADYISFKQVGGVMRFPVKNMPSMGTFELTVKGVTITGEFPVDLTKLGETAMVAGTPATAPEETPDVTPDDTTPDDTTPDDTPAVASEVYSETVVITYAADVDGDLVEYNVPVPTGVYTGFTVVIKDESGDVVFTKEYVQENKVDRATLLIMSELEVPARNMDAPEVWPYFVDARVVLPEVVEGETQYAVYVDGAAEPELKDIEMVGEKATVVVGGDFAHNSTHTVAVAKVLNGVVLTSTKSAEVEFSTANIFQMTQNTGTKFVTVGWDDVAVANGTKYENGRWNAAPQLPEKDGLTGTQRRGYHVQLYAADKSTVLYDMIPFDGHVGFSNAFSDSSWLGRKDGVNIMIPTALAFGYLEPGTDYYFRVKTLDAPVTFNKDNGNYDPTEAEYILTSERGGCGWSDFVKLTTDTPYVEGPNDILYEGFNDIMVANDYMNWAPGVVPDVYQQPVDWDTYAGTHLKTGYPEFLDKAAGDRDWTAQTFSKVVRAFELGIQDKDYAEKTEMTFTEDAGSLKDWVWWSKKNTYGIFPIFGAIRIGQTNGTGNNAAILKTPKLDSDKLLTNKGTKCIISFKMSFSSGAIAPTSIPNSIWIQLYRDAEGLGDSGYTSEYQLSYKTASEDDYNSKVLAYHQSDADYAHHQQYFDLSIEMYLRKGDRVGFLKPTGSSHKGTLVLDDIKIEVVPGEYEQNDFVDDGVGTEPDETDYDIFGLGEFPITYWWTIPEYAHGNDEAKTRELYADMAATGINVVVYNGEVNYSVAENKRIMDIAGELGMKFIGRTLQYGEYTDERISAIKENFATSPNYIGEYLYDEPTAAMYDELGDFTKRYLSQIPDKEVYINLYPTYSGTLGTTSYDRYIEEYLDKIPTKSLSFDYYGLGTEPGRLASDYFLNIDLVRAKTLNLRMPFWVITQAGKVNNNRKPNEKEQRWTVWSNIALGSKGISYFCYWTPGNDTDFMVSRDGVKTDMYYWVKQINADINSVGKKLLPCHADGAILTSTKYYPLYINAGVGRTNYGPIKGVSGDNSILCGCFRDARASENGENYKGYKALVMSEMPNRDVNAYVTLDPSVSEITITQNNTTQTVDLNNLMDVTVAGENGVKLTYSNGELTLTIPEGEALLIEF